MNIAQLMSAAAATTRLAKALAARPILVVGGLVLAMALTKTTIGPKLIPLCLTLWALVSLARHVVVRVSDEWRKTVWRSDRDQVIKNAVIALRKCRKTLGLTREVELLYLGSVGLMWVVFGLVLCLPWRRLDSSSLTTVQLAILGVAGFIDAIQILRRLHGVAWARWSGKVMYAGVAAFSIWCGNIFAKKAVAQATLLDPKQFADTERLLQWLAAPWFGLSVIVGVICVLSLAAYLAAFCVLAVGKFWTTVVGFFRRTAPTARADSFTYRLVFGKRQKLGAALRWDWDPLVRLMRPFAIGFAGVCLLLSIQPLVDMPPETLNPAIRKLVVAIEFNEGQRCGKSTVSEPSVHLEEGKIAVAIKTNGDWTLEPDTCEVEKRTLTSASH